jgi:hypothetical protein
MANLYVGYYASQRTGATYHSPQNCLPGAGWVMREPESIEIKTADGKSFHGEFLSSGKRRLPRSDDLLVSRSRTFEASEYADKINTIWDSAAAPPQRRSARARDDFRRRRRKSRDCRRRRFVGAFVRPAGAFVPE